MTDISLKGSSMTDLAILDIAGPPHPKAQWHENLQSMEALGFYPKILINDQPQGSWPQITDTDSARLERLLSIISDPAVKYINALRGGYGCSNLLPLIPWQKLAMQSEKIMIGFSDITALQSAFFHILGWPSIHGPMPGNKMWNTEDFQKTMQLAQGKPLSLALTDLSPEKPLPMNSGQPCLLFGGCLSVLSNLIGTPYLQPFKKPCILFFEDIEESPGRVMRMLNQWQQSPMLQNVKAIILGRFCYGKAEDEALHTPIIHEIFKQRCTQKIFSSTAFGHASPNIPLVIGGQGNISKNQLHFAISLRSQKA